MKTRQNQNNILQTVYQKCPAIEYDIKDGKIFIVKNQKHWIQSILRRLGFKIPEKTYLELDGYGSFVFQQINGKKSVENIGKELVSKYSETEECLYERLILYFEFLENNKQFIYKINRI